ncbi:hypothetical protein GCM10007937_26740 [Mesorhizobium albiziae]|nr:hypothetical protein GCM10007937_26740 [Mesorhizobium albiziae]
MSHGNGIKIRPPLKTKRCNPNDLTANPRAEKQEIVVEVEFRGCTEDGHITALIKQISPPREDGGLRSILN